MFKEMKFSFSVCSGSVFLRRHEKSFPLKAKKQANFVCYLCGTSNQNVCMVVLISALSSLALFHCLVLKIGCEVFPRWGCVNTVLLTPPLFNAQIGFAGISAFVCL